MPNIKVLLDDIPLDTLFRVADGETAIVVLRKDGRIRAFEDVCPHAFWPLSSGEVDGDLLICPGHGWEFSVETGQCQNAAGYCLQPVPLTVEGVSVIFHYDGLHTQRPRGPVNKAMVQIEGNVR